MKGKSAKPNFDELSKYLGEDVTRLVNELAKKKDYSEFKLAEALGKEVNETRNLLYRLHSLNLASFIKKKDNKVGWYIYYWTFHEEKVNGFVLKEMKSRLELIKDRSSRDGGQGFFSCKNKCASLDFDKAFDFSFRCPECGELLGQDAGGARQFGLAEEIKRLEKEIRKLEKREEADNMLAKEQNEMRNGNET